MLVHTLKAVEIDNAVAEAVYLVFGGIPEAARALGIVPQGVRNTLTEGKVATRLNAEPSGATDFARAWPRRRVARSRARS